jgi:hypothetical protein
VLLPVLVDVDTAADAALVAREAPATRFAAAVAALPTVAALPATCCRNDGFALTNVPTRAGSGV